MEAAKVTPAAPSDLEMRFAASTSLREVDNQIDILHRAYLELKLRNAQLEAQVKAKDVEIEQLKKGFEAASKATEKAEKPTEITPSNS